MNALGEYRRIKCEINHNSKKSRLCHSISRSAILRNALCTGFVDTDRDIQVEWRDHLFEILLFWSIKCTSIIPDTFTERVLYISLHKYPLLLDFSSQLFSNHIVSMSFLITNHNFFSYRLIQSCLLLTIRRG